MNNKKFIPHEQLIGICATSSKEAVIKPIEWPSQPPSSTLTSQDFVGMEFYSPNLGSLLGDDNVTISQQADRHHCGILSIYYLKKLLKNKAQELRQGSLMFSFYDEEGNIKRFFMPSPTVLQYSQSSEFLELLPQLITINEQTEERENNISFTQVDSEQLTDDSLQTEESDELTTEISNQEGNFLQENNEGLDEEYIEEDEHYVSHIEAALMNSLERAKSSNDENMIKHLTDTLEKLPNFREQWLAGYEIACKKRALMSYEDRYVYLSYAAKRMQDEIARTPESEGPDNLSTEPSSYSF